VYFVIDWKCVADADVIAGCSVYLDLIWLSAFGKRQKEGAEVY
jgi:hypothetical protein